MKIAIVVLLSLVLGVSAGLGLNRAEFGGIEERFANTRYRPAEAKDEIEVIVLPAKCTVVGEDEFNFGTLRRFHTDEYRFAIRNDGDDLLRIAFHKRSCGKCIAAKVSSEEIGSGKTVEVPIQYHTGKADEDFYEYVEFVTNDPDKPMLRLAISGKVTEEIRTSAGQIRVDNASASDEISQSFRIYGYHTEVLDVISQQWTDPETANNFDLEITPLDVAALEMDPRPLAAREVRVTMKPGMPIGPITQSLMLEVQAEDSSMLNIPVVGTVISDISVLGPRTFHQSKNLLVIGRVNQDEGTTSKLQIRVRGPQRDSVELRVESTDPAEALHAEIGERVAVGDTAYMYPLTISVPPGAPLVNRVGSAQGDFAKITIATTHSDSRQLIILVRMIVE